MSYTMTQTGNDCTVQPNAQLIIPLIPLREPSYYVDLSCTPSAEKACLSPTDSPELMLAHTLFGEGGSSISSQSSANIMQVALNRINAYYGRRGMSASSLSSEDFAKLLVRVMAMPYDTGQGTSEPAFNAFSEPYPHDNTQGTINWDETMRLVQSILNSNGQVYPNGLTPTIGAEVTTYCSQDALLDPPADPTPDDGNNGIAMIEEGGGRKQYYFNDGRIPNCVK